MPGEIAKKTLLQLLSAAPVAVSSIAQSSVVTVVSPTGPVVPISDIAIDLLKLSSDNAKLQSLTKTNTTFENFEPPPSGSGSPDGVLMNTAITYGPALRADRFKLPEQTSEQIDPITSTRNDLPPEGSIEFSLLGVTIKLTNVEFNSDSFKLILGVTIYVLVAIRIFPAYRALRHRHMSYKAIKEAEGSFNNLFDELFTHLAKFSSDDTTLIVVSNGRTEKYNVLAKEVQRIGKKIPALQEKYQNKINPMLAQALQDLYEATIINPSDISKIKLSVEKVRRAGKEIKLGTDSIKLLEHITIQLSNLGK